MRERLVPVGDRRNVYTMKSNVVGVREVFSSNMITLTRVDTKMGDVFYVEGTADEVMQQLEESRGPLNG